MSHLKDLVMLSALARRQVSGMADRENLLRQEAVWTGTCTHLFIAGSHVQAPPSVRLCVWQAAHLAYDDQRNHRAGQQSAQ